MNLDVKPEPKGRSLTTASGMNFHYHDFDQLGSSTSPPAVFFHGGGPGCTGWSDFGQVSALFARDRRCVLVDLLQYGKSDKPSIDEPMWDFHARENLGLLDALGFDCVDLICNSWGGTGALNLAALFPERVRRLVITGSMPVFYGPLAPLPERAARGRSARDAYYGGSGPTLEKIRELMARFEWFDPDRIPEATIEMRYAQSITPGESSINDEPSRRGIWQDLTDRLGRIVAPTLFCWGMYDAFLTPDYPLMLASRLEHGQLYVMDRAAHHLQEERPWEYYSTVTGFLNQDDPR